MALGGFDWIWLDLAGCGLLILSGFAWIQLVINGFRWILKGFGWIQLDLCGFSRIQVDLDAFSWIQLHLTGFSWFYDNKIPIHMYVWYGMYGMVW